MCEERERESEGRNYCFKRLGIQTGTVKPFVFLSKTAMNYDCRRPEQTYKALLLP